MAQSLYTQTCVGLPPGVHIATHKHQAERLGWCLSQLSVSLILQTLHQDYFLKKKEVRLDLPYSHTDLFTEVTEGGEVTVAVTHIVLTLRAGVLTPLTQVCVDVCKRED